MLFGEEKSLIDQMKHSILYGRNSDQEKYWNKLLESMQRRQNVLNKISVDWCLPVSFSKNEIGNASWHSDHCLAFTRILLFQFADLDGMFGVTIHPTELKCE